jgi:toxin ParE1/3/4
MHSRILIRPSAWREFDHQAEYLARTSVATAQRFQEATEQTFQEIARMPEIGSPYPLANPRLQGLRCWPVRGFKKHLIFYRLVDGGVEILHILYGARNIPAILEEKP